MTENEFIDQCKTQGVWREGDQVAECHCGLDCSGWKIYRPEYERRLADAIDRLPEIMLQAAEKLGREMAVERNRRFLAALLSP